MMPAPECVIDWRKPTPSQYGLTEQSISGIKAAEAAYVDLTHATSAKYFWRGVVIGGGIPIVYIISISQAGNASAAFLLSLMYVPVGIGVGLAVSMHLCGKELKGEALAHKQEYSKVLQYEGALAEWQKGEERKKAEYWTKMDGWQFEKQIAELYRRQGYRVDVTPGSGDEGIDLIMERQGKAVVVQCKQHAQQASPHVVRDLYGAMVHKGADRAILVCTSGFSPGVHTFVQGKPIELVDLPAILKLES